MLMRGLGRNLWYKDMIDKRGEKGKWIAGMANCPQLPQKPTNQDQKVNKDKLDLTYTFNMLDVHVCKVFVLNREHPFLWHTQNIYKNWPRFPFHMVVDPKALSQSYKTSGRTIRKELLRLLIAFHMSFQVCSHMSHFILRNNGNTIFIVPMRPPRTGQ